MVFTVKQSAVDALSLLSQVLPMTSAEATQEVAIALNSRINQQVEDIGANQTAIAALQAQIAQLPNLQEAERAEVLQMIQEHLPNLEISFAIGYRGEQIDAPVFLQMLADQQAAKPVGVSEVQRTNGYVSSAKVLFDDGHEQTVTFTRNEVDGIATYTGQLADGAGGVMDGYEMRFQVSKLVVEGLSLNQTWDQDLISQRLFVAGLSVEFEAISPESPEDVPDTLWAHESQGNRLEQ
ncbi:MAG: hypothetical protein AAGI45_07955 [Cyanobacteria bacterium P01_H01_bin.26]